MKKRTPDLILILEIITRSGLVRFDYFLTLFDTVIGLKMIRGSNMMDRRICQKIHESTSQLRNEIAVSILFDSLRRSVERK